MIGTRVMICATQGNRYEQVKALKEGCEIIVATPGRLIDLIKDKVNENVLFMESIIT